MPDDLETDARRTLPVPEPGFAGDIGRTVSASRPHRSASVAPPAGAPNVVLILLDDAGFGDSSTFGGVARTPALDRLAARGLRFSNFHTTAMCSPTRAALLTGRNHHRVGFGCISEAAIDYPGYDGRWKPDTASIAQVLRLNGYRTSAFGKWHNTPLGEIGPLGPYDRWPTSLGFEHFYGFLSGMESQWEPTHMYRDTTSVDPASEREDYHFTTDVVDHAIEWLRLHQESPDRPYLLYLATGATHAPHHAPRRWIDEYRGAFDRGWDELREEVFARQKDLGLIPGDAVLPPRPPEIPAWDSLTPEQRRVRARQMEAYAGFLAHTDHQIGRLLTAVEEGPGADDTLVIYIVGDNGADGWGGDGYAIRYGTDESYVTVEEQTAVIDELGGPGLMNMYAAGWAWLGNTPFRESKCVASHLGGLRDGMVAAWPSRIPDPGAVRGRFGHVNDVAATIYEAAGVPAPDTVLGVAQQPLDGRSLLDAFLHPGGDDHPDRTQYFEMLGNRGIYRNGWFACKRQWTPSGSDAGWESPDDGWELYDLRSDPTQAHDLAETHPDQLEALRAAFDDEAWRNGVYPLGAPQHFVGL